MYADTQHTQMEQQKAFAGKHIYTPENYAGKREYKSKKKQHTVQKTTNNSNKYTQSKCTEHPTLQANVYLEPVGLSFHTDALRFIHVCPVGVRDGETRVGQFARLTKQKQT